MSEYTFTGGGAYAAPYGQEQVFQFLATAGTTWDNGDTWQIDSAADQGDFMLGAGWVAGINPVYGLALAERMYICAGSQFNFSDNNDPSSWEEQNPGAGYVDLLSNYGIQDTTMSLATYQGMLAVLMQQTIQIWVPNADPTQMVLRQVLSNIGTVASYSVQSLGDWDVVFLSQTGFRSLRVRDSSLNALIVDLGTPIDAIVQNALLGYIPGTTPAPVSIVDPGTGRYWCFLNDTFYVLSYYPNSKITAWNTYLPTFASGENQVSFVPTQIIVYKGRVYVRGTASGTDYVFLYGGASNNVYDKCVATVQTPWLPAKKPSSNKIAFGVDLALRGTWSVSVCMDPTVVNPFSNPGTQVAKLSGSTYDASTPDGIQPGQSGLIALPGRGTHFAFFAQCSDDTPGPNNPVLSALTLVFEGADVS